MEHEITQKFIGFDAIFQYTASGVQLVSGLLFYVVISHLFSKGEVGAIALFLAIIGLFNTFFSFGLGNAAQHFTSYNLGNGDLSSVRQTVFKFILFGFIFSMLGFIALMVFSGEISLIFLHSSSYTGLVRILAVVLIGNITLSILNGVLLGIQSFRISAIINIIIWTTYYFGSVIFAYLVRSLDMIIIGWLIGVFLGVAFQLFFILYSMRKYSGPGMAPKNSHLFKYSVPILFSGLISYGAFYADRFIVSGLLSLSSLGVYNFSLLIASSIGFIVIPFNNILMPKFSEFFGKGELGSISAYVKISTLLLSSIFVPAAVGVAAIAPSIMNFIAGSSYLGAVEPLKVILVFSAIFVSSNILIQAIASVRKTRVLIFSSALSLSSNFVLSFVLIPIYGIVGAAFGFSSIYVSTFIVLYFATNKEKICSFNVLAIFKVWISSLIMYLLVYVAVGVFGNNPLFLPIEIGFGILVYMVLSRLFKVFDPETKRMVLSLFPESNVKVRKVISILLLH